ncbi:MAG: hypothetical protein HY071_03560 [Chloroflexi bacterium]|nr:hypothetical protein [Chloroflexota bacterium]
MTNTLPRAEALELVLRETQRALAESDESRDVTADESTRLMGSQAPLNSVGLVSLIISLEREIDARFGRKLELADDRAMSRRPSPFRTVGTLADYIAERVSE